MRKMWLYYSSSIKKSAKTPFPGEILVKEGDRVSPHTTILRTNFRLGRPCILNISRALKVEPDEIGDYLQVSEGDEVNFRDIIAKRRVMVEEKQVKSPVDGFIEMIDTGVGVIIVRERLEKPDVPVIIDCKSEHPDENMREYIQVEEGERVEYGKTVAGSTLINGLPWYTNKMSANCSGVVSRIDYEEGKIWIEKDLPTVEIKANYRGEVVNIISDLGVEMEFSGYSLEGIYGTGDITSGKLVTRNDDLSGNIVYADYLNRKEMESLLKDKPSGLILSSVDYGDVEILKDNSFPAIILEGFGRLKLNQRYRSFLESSIGKFLTIKGYTQVRAGVIRPEIIVYSNDEYYEVKSTGQRYRVVWGEHFGTIGNILDEPYFGETPSGTRTLLCDIEVEGGDIITVPFNNVEIMR